MINTNARTTIDVNGRSFVAENGLLSDVLKAFNITLEARGVAIAKNEHVVPRTRWQDDTLEAGDRIEIVRATQGG